jgi:membrane associated rhomboid family serine protease
MFPIRDNIPSKNYPVVNYSLIALNVAVFLIQLMLGSDENAFVFTYGFVPARYTVRETGLLFSMDQQFLSIFSFMFLHGGFFHLISNMWTLYIIGDNVEDHLGPGKYLAFYILCGLASGMAHFVSAPYSNVPVIGASGAIAGIMGAYFMLFPRARILTLFFFPFIWEIPAYVFLGLWFLIQIFSVMGSGIAASGIAWWAHIGGFVFGVLMLRLFHKLPSTGVSGIISKATQRKKTFGLQTIRPVSPMDQPDLYGTIVISNFEAMTGTTKMVNVPWGFQSRMYKVDIPAGVTPGRMIRLKGLGRIQSDGGRGDLYLRVAIDNSMS